MKFIVLFIAVVGHSLLFSQTYKNVNNTASVKSAIEKKHEETKSLMADFKEKVTSKMLKEPQISTGKFYFKKDNKVRWEHDSGRQTILIDGDKVKLYENGKLINNVASQKIVQQIQGMMLSMLSGEFLNEKDFSISYQESATDYKLTLTPKHPRMSKYMQKIELIFSKSSLLMEEMTMVEKSGQKIMYTFSNVKANQTIHDTKFTNL